MMPVKIGFVLLSNSRDPIPSTRIAALNMFPYLRAANFDPQIVYDPPANSETPTLPDLAHTIAEQDYRIVIFQKVHGPSVLALARALSARGIKTVYLVCDLVVPEMAQATDATIAVTDFLGGLYPAALKEKICVVHDGIEHPEVVKTEWSEHHGSPARPLHAVLVTSNALDELPVLGSPPAWLKVTIVGRYAPRANTRQRLREMRWETLKKQSFSARVSYLKFRSHRRIRCEAWTPEDVYSRLQMADIGIIPIRTEPAFIPGTLPPPAWIVKSENRLTMKMAAGLPVIATPIPSYECVIDQGNNGFLARSRQEWLAFLEMLRDPALRRSIGEQARASVLHRYSMEEQARRLVDVLERLC